MARPLDVSLGVVHVWAESQAPGRRAGDTKVAIERIEHLSASITSHACDAHAGAQLFAHRCDQLVARLEHALLGLLCERHDSPRHPVGTELIVKVRRVADRCDGRVVPLSERLEATGAHGIGLRVVSPPDSHAQGPKVRNAVFANVEEPPPRAAP